MAASDQDACLYCAADAADHISGPDDVTGLPVPWLTHLYVCLGLSTYQIAARTGIDRQRVTRALRRAGVAIRPRGTGRSRLAARSGELPGLPRLLRALYEDAKLSSPQIADLLGMPERTVRDRLRMYGITARTRGQWNREDRATVQAETLTLLYGQLGMTADEVGQRLGMSRNLVLRSAHALGIAVRTGGVVTLPGPGQIELIRALYGDPLIDAVLTTHDLPRVPPGGRISDRFPRPVPLTSALVKDLYWGCGAGLIHIELLTGQPALTIRNFMRRTGIPLRHPGGRTPFLRRWRQGNAPSAATRHATVTPAP
jgi:hypothetical protein